MSVTIVATRHPKKLMKYLHRCYSVHKMERGIYYVHGDTSETQIIVSEELSAEDNLWLNTLRNDLTAEQLEKLVDNSQQNLPMDAYAYVISEANPGEMEEMGMRKKKGIIVSEKFDAMFGAPFVAQGIAVGEARGEVKAVLTFLRARFKKIPREVEETIRGMTDPVALESWAEHAATCTSMEEFAEAIK